MGFMTDRRQSIAYSFFKDALFLIICNRDLQLMLSELEDRFIWNVPDEP